MSTLKVNKLRDTAGSTDAIVLDPNGGAVLAGVTTVTSVKVGAAVTISESGIEASGIGITCANINGTQIGGRRNIIINGAMNVAQRGTSGTGTGYKTIDRFGGQGSGTHGITQSQDTDVPTGEGFSKSLKIDCTTANASPSASHYLTITYRIEAQDLQQIANGTSNAKKLTLSFYVKSPKIGNHAVGLYKPDNTQRQNTKTYSVSVANTWEKKTITFDGDTSGGGIANDNGSGIQIDWHLLAGSNYTSVDSTSWVNYSDAAWAYGHAVNVLDDTANNFYITGVQLEVGSQATPFEHRSFGEELLLCQRYYQEIGMSVNLPGTTSSSAFANLNVPIACMMRAAPTIAGGITYHGWHGDNGGVNNNGTAMTVASYATNDPQHSPALRGTISGFSLTDNRSGSVCANSGTPIKMDSEL